MNLHLGHVRAEQTERTDPTTSAARATRARRLMRPLNVLVLLSIVLANGVAGAEPRESGTQLTELAAEAYANSDWEGAVGHYTRLVEEGYVHPSLFYNLGTAHLRAGDKGRGVLMLLRAIRLAPRDRDIRDNLELAAPEVFPQIAIFPVPPVEFAYRQMTLNEWAGTAWALTILAAVSVSILFLFVLPDEGRRRFKKVTWGFVALAGLSHAFAAVMYYEQAYTPWAVVVAEDAYPRAAPSDRAETYDFVLQPGTIVRAAYAGRSGWIKAIYGGANEVFLESDQIEHIRTRPGP